MATIFVCNNLGLYIMYSHPNNRWRWLLIFCSLLFLRRREQDLTFKIVFKGKSSYLSEKLEISGNLLRKLKDIQLITKEHVTKIQEKSSNEDKVECLLEILGRRDDSQLRDFFKILIGEGQSHVVKMLLPEDHSMRSELFPEELDAELKKIVEPDYGLTELLYGEYVIEQKEVVLGTKPVTERVARLLQAVKQKCGNLTDETFLEMLKVKSQNHVVNFIRAGGKREHDYNGVWPLNEQQRRRLFCSENVTEELDLHKSSLLDLLEKSGVISLSQLDDIASRGTRIKRVKRLLRILERRSLADVDQFVNCLKETGPKALINWLDKVGAILCIRTTIDGDKSPENIFSTEKKFEKGYQENGHSSEGMSVQKARSVFWYIMCSTVQSLESLRWVYESPSGYLTYMLQGIFNAVCNEVEKFQLSVEWRFEDYENCKRFLNETSGQPFEVHQRVNTKLKAVGILIVWIVILNCIIQLKICVVLWTVRNIQ